MPVNAQWYDSTGKKQALFDEKVVAKKESLSFKRARILSFFYFNLYVTNSSYNYGNNNNKEYTDLVVKAKTVDANDCNKQFEDYKKAEEILLEQDSAHVPVYQSASNYLINPKNKQVEYPSYGGYFFLRNAELTE